jgi:hypothetical protein
MSYKKLLVMRKLKTDDIPEAESVAGQKKMKEKKHKTTSGPQWEFTYRLPNIWK